jgi:hypothetical protein
MKDFARTNKIFLNFHSSDIGSGNIPEHNVDFSKQNDQDKESGEAHQMIDDKVNDQQVDEQLGNCIEHSNLHVRPV